MPCESCGVQFSVFRRKRACSECERLYCAACLRRGGGMCAPCRALSTRPLQRLAIAHLKARDLQCFLQRQNISTRGCVEKEELVSLCVSHVNSAAYRRRGPRYSPGPFTSLKGLTTNFNDFLNSAFDLRGQTATAPDTNSNCYNSAHVHAPHVTTGAPSAPPARERFTVAPGGERDVREPTPLGSGPMGLASRSESSGSAPLDTADCFEIEDLDDAGWEFVTRPADPLPNDSEVLMTAPEADGGGTDGRSEAEGRGSPEAIGGAAAVRLERATLGGTLGGTPVRAASELELHRSESADTADSASLQDEPLMDHEPGEPSRAAPVSLEQVRRLEQLSSLSVRQLKELLARNRVEYRGCLERDDLLQRATALWKDHAKYRDIIDSLPIEECCKICMAAPLECVLLECGHIAACTGCAKQLAECPICRQYVVRAVRCFRS